MVLHAARRPYDVVAGMAEKQFPRRQGLLRAGLLYVFGERAAPEEVIESIFWPSVLFLAVADVGLLLARLQTEDVVVAVGLAEGPVVEEVVAHPDIDHRGLRRNGLHCRVRIDAGLHCEKPWIAGSDESSAS